MQFFGVDINKEKVIFLNLQKIFGVNENLAGFICKECGFFMRVPWKFLNKAQLFYLERWMGERFYFSFLFGVDKKIKEQEKKKLSIKIKSYKGFRYKIKLPVNGQRTKTNAKTVKRF